jgi:formylglycine-generating enzyme required for sulfatase activity
MVNKAELRQFLTQYFNDNELEELCFDYFPDLLNDFTAGMTKSQKAIALISYCDRRGRMDHLLTALSKLRPEAYKDQFGLVPSQQKSDLSAQRNPNQIFLSHAHQDAAFARELAGDLRDNGFEIWIAPESIEPGEKWVDAIERGLETSGIFLLVITPHAVNSKWVRDESNYAIALQNKNEMRLFTLHVGEGRMPPLWSVRQHISFREDYDEGLRQLLAALRPGQTAKPAAAAPPPPVEEPVKTEPPPATPKPAPRKRRAPAKPAATAATVQAAEPAGTEKPSADPVVAATEAPSKTPAAVEAAPASATASEPEATEPPPITRAPERPASLAGDTATRATSAPIVAPDPAPDGPAAKPAARKPLYWALGAVALLAVMVFGWRLMAAGSGETGTPVAGVTPATPTEDTGGVGTNPTRQTTSAPTRTPTRPSPTRTPTRPAPAEAQAGDIRTITLPGDVAVEQVFVPAGSFMMGSEDGADDEKPVHEVTLDAFWIDRTEVTNAQFAAFTADTGYITTAESEGGGYTVVNNDYAYTDGADWQHPQGPASNLNGLSRHPVVLVSGDDAAAYCEWTGGRLPTEAEWEFAARGPDSPVYPWGDAFDGEKLNYCDRNCPFDHADQDVDDGYEFTAPAGSYPNGASWIGALDLAGNVWEWVNDWYGEYGSSSQTNPTGPSSGEYRVLRGGAWGSFGIYARSSFRFGYQPGGRNLFIGFRCAQE